jgi:hypothetical protein
MAEQPKISIQKKDKSPTDPIDQKPMTLEEARLLDKQTGGAAALEPKAKTAPVPRKDYTQTPSPPPDFGIAANEEPSRLIIEYGRHGQVSDVIFQGHAALLTTSGRFRSQVGNIVTRAEIARRRQQQDRIVAKEKADLEAAKSPAKKK